MLCCGFLLKVAANDSSNLPLIVHWMIVADLRTTSNNVQWSIRTYEDEITSAFFKEVKTLWHLRQSHIVHIMDVFRENNTIYYVMEYINGKNLRNIVSENGPLPEDVALSYIKQVAKGLVYMHKKRRLHLDIKPDNIIVDKKGYSYIVDLSSSVHLDNNGLLSNTSKVETFSYCYSPYEIETKSCPPTSASDVYSLGATLYFLLTGNNPADAVKIMIGADHLVPLPETISPALRSVVEKAMRKSPNHRYQSMEHFLKHLKSL